VNTHSQHASSSAKVPGDESANEEYRFFWRRVSGGHLCAAVLIVYAISFLLPVFDNTGAHHDHMSPTPRGVVYGWNAFILGLLSFFFPPGGWLANVGVWIGAVFLAIERWRGAWIAGGVALLLGATYLYLLTDRSIVSQKEYLAGYYCWLASMAILAVAGLARDIRA
jgi:hypothetical protein